MTELISQSLEISREVIDRDFTKANNAKHKAIVDAIAAKKPADAGKAMAAHFVLIERWIRHAS